MRAEFEERIRDLSEQELEYMESMAIYPKDKRFKWRRVWFDVDDIFAVMEVTETETMIEFHDGSKMIVKGSYSATKKHIEKHSPTEEDLEI